MDQAGRPALADEIVIFWPRGQPIMSILLDYFLKGFF